MENKNYQDLFVWQKADQAFRMVCEDVRSWPGDTVSRAIVKQLIPAVGSISANIAEGYGRGLPREFEQFLRYARGSSAETDNWLYKAMGLGYISRERYDTYQLAFFEINKMIGSFINRLREQPRRKPAP